VHPQTHAVCCASLAVPPPAVVASAALAALGEVAPCPGDVVPSLTAVVVASVRAQAACGLSPPYRGRSEPGELPSEPRAAPPSPAPQLSSLPLSLAATK